MVCEHIKQVGLLDIQSYDFCDGRDVIANKYGIPWGDFAISQRDWHFIKDIIRENNVKSVLEFGAGLSSLLMSETVDVTCYETWAETKKIIEDTKTAENKLTIHLWDGKDIDDYPKKKFDLAFVDGDRSDGVVVAL